VRHAELATDGMYVSTLHTLIRRGLRGSTYGCDGTARAGSVGLVMFGERGGERGVCQCVRIHTYIHTYIHT